jgi:peroxiredoxin
VLVSTRAVNMAVTDFFLGGVTHVHDLDVEVQVLSSQRMIGIDCHRLAIHRDYGNDLGAILGLCVKAHPDLHILGAFECAAVHLATQLIVDRAVAFFRGDHYVQFVTRSLAFQCLFQPHDNALHALDVGERVGAFGSIEHVSLIVLERVVDGDNFVFLNLHGEFPRYNWQIICILRVRGIRANRALLQLGIPPIIVGPTEISSMVLTPSIMQELGMSAPAFRLPNTEGKIVALDDFGDAPAFLIVFMCNHCPYVKHIGSGLAAFARDYQGRGLAMVGVNSNDVSAHPDDSPEAMRREVESRGYVFPYLYDETQEVARAYGAACTPDFFLFDGERKLVYRGQFDGARPNNQIPVTGEDLRAAVDAVLAGRSPSAEQVASIGCNIKWKPGNEPGSTV